MKRIYIIGYMGSGKTSVGKALAKVLNWDFIDLDDLIRSRSSYDIPSIFKHFGETTFRELESSALRSTRKRNNLVIATGGGAPCYFDNIDQMKSYGTVIYLKVPPDVIRTRVLADANIRPLLANKSETELIAYIEHHLNSRITFYEQAHHIIDANRNINTINHEILDVIQ